MNLRDDIEREIAVEAAAHKSASAPRDFLRRWWSRLDRVAAPVLRFLCWVAPRLLRLLVRIAEWLAFDAKGHFDPRRFGLNVVKLAIVATVVPLLSGAVYYYVTWTTYRDIYVPSSGVFQSQNFVHPSGPGQIVAPRDEIYTVLGKQIEPDGEVMPVRFDLDVNWYFFFFRDALRPDLAAAKMDSQSPYGVRCDFEATGFYTRLPRYWRLWFVKWVDLRAEIVDVIKCEEVTVMPAAFRTK